MELFDERYRKMAEHIIERERKTKDYFADLVGPVGQEKVEEIREAISRQGFWGETDEWRMFTYIALRIEPSEGEHETQWYRVIVRNDIEVTCECPTLPRAVHFLRLLAQLTKDVLWTHGPSTWA